MAKAVAQKYGWPFTDYPADWDKHGKAAGPYRNTDMITKEDPRYVLGFHRDWRHSSGTYDMINKARLFDVTAFVWNEKGELDKVHIRQRPL
jgi:hypothetical protein